MDSVRSPLVVGLTGGVASGKSTCAARCADLGHHVVNADHLGHEAYAPGSRCMKQIVKAFGREVLAADEATIDRGKLGAIVFESRSELKRLTDIVWPEIRRLAEDRISKSKETSALTGAQSMIVLEAAVLVEAQWYDMVDVVIVIESSPEVALKRLMARNTELSEENARSRIDSQLSTEQRSKRLSEESKLEVLFVDSNCSVDAMLSQLTQHMLRLSI